MGDILIKLLKIQNDIKKGELNEKKRESKNISWYIGVPKAF